MKIQFLIPYFGKLPNYFPAFLHTIAREDEKIYYTLFTDDASIDLLSIPHNLDVIKMSFEGLNKLAFSKGLGPIFFPYKLCDYRPTFGVLFEDYISSDCEYWGHCDIDTLMGDIPAFLEANNYKEYTRFGREGAFVIYKNNEFSKFLFKSKYKGQKKLADFDYVRNTTYPCSFDEVGMNHMCSDLGVKFLPRSFFAGVGAGYFHLHTWGNGNNPQLLTWENGHAFCYTEKDGAIEKKEVMYIHFLDHKDLPVNEPLSNSIMVTHLGFFHFDEKNLNMYIEDYGAVDTDEDKNRIKKIKKKNRRLIQIRYEIEKVGLFRACENFMYRIWVFIANWFRII